MAKKKAKAPETAPAIRDRIKELRRVRAADLLPSPYNWRTHPQSQQDALRGTLSEIGYADALIARELATGQLELIDGHLRKETTPDQTVPVLVLDVDEEEAKKLLATLDPLAAMATADSEQLERLLQSVNVGDAALSAMLEGLAKEHGVNGRDRPWDDPGTVQQCVDQAEELAKKWKTEEGQLWQVGPHRLLCGDSTSQEDVARLMDGKKAVLMATDPPYMVDYHGGNHPRSLTNSLLVKDRHSADYLEQDSPHFLKQFLAAALGTALNENPAIYLWHAHKRQKLVEEELTAAGVMIHQQIIWVKSRAVLTHSHYMWQHEPCFYGWISGKQPRRPPANGTTVWQIDQCGLEGIHPTEKPLEIFTRPIEGHTLPGELVYEPFSGSGSQLIAAQQLGRVCYAMEKSPAFVACALERLSRHDLTPEVV